MMNKSKIKKSKWKFIIAFPIFSVVFLTLCFTNSESSLMYANAQQRTVAEPVVDSVMIELTTVVAKDFIKSDKNEDLNSRFSTYSALQAKSLHPHLQTVNSGVDFQLAS